MPDEFDEITQAPGTSVRPAPRAGACSPRLVARLFTAASVPLRLRLLHCLMRPLGLLGAAGVASGAFACFVGRHDTGNPGIDAEAVARLSSRQVLELARFVEQVDPQALQQFAGLAASSPLALASFSVPVLVLLYRRLHPDLPHEALAVNAPPDRCAAAPQPLALQSAGPAVPA